MMTDAFERGNLQVGELLISPRTKPAELEGRYVSKGETGGSARYTLAPTVAVDGVEMTVRCVFRRDRLEQITLSPVNADGSQQAYDMSCSFLNALMGCTDNEFPWGRVETHLFPDYHDDYHGGDVYITYR